MGVWQQRAMSADAPVGQGQDDGQQEGESIMTKRWKMVLGALAIALAWAAAAWGDHVYMPDQDPYERAALGAGVGSP